MIPTSIDKENAHGIKPLSRRENQVIIFLAEGLRKQTIAERLGISKNTVASHVSHIFRKLGVKNTHGAVGKAYRCGLLSLD